jgi:hypothetical protein
MMLILTYWHYEESTKEGKGGNENSEEKAGVIGKSLFLFLRRL